MKDLKYISYIEELNGLNESIFLLEQRLKEGGGDKETRMRLLFAYWFMEHEPAFMTNNKGERNWVECFTHLLNDCEEWGNDVDFNWTVGFLLCHFSGLPKLYQKGKVMLARAIELSPNGILPKLALLATQQKPTASAVIGTAVIGNAEELKLDAWGMMGEYFRQMLLNKTK